MDVADKSPNFRINAAPKKQHQTRDLGFSTGQLSHGGRTIEMFYCGFAVTGPVVARQELSSEARDLSRSTRGCSANLHNCTHVHNPPAYLTPDWCILLPHICVPDENARLHDPVQHAAHLAKRAALRDAFEVATRAWIISPSPATAHARDQAVLMYRIASIEADPFIRPRTVYHRHGNLLEDGTVHWNYKSGAGDQDFGVPVETLRGMLKTSDGEAAVAENNGGDLVPVADGEVEKVTVYVNGNGNGVHEIGNGLEEKMGALDVNTATQDVTA